MMLPVGVVAIASARGLDRDQLKTEQLIHDKNKFQIKDQLKAKDQLEKQERTQK